MALLTLFATGSVLAAVLIAMLMVGSRLLVGRYLDARQKRVQEKEIDHLSEFLKRHGWKNVVQESESLVSRLKPMAGTLYEQYDWYWQKRFEQEFPKPEQVLMARFDTDGQCDVVEGTRWDVAIYQLNELLKLQTDDEKSRHVSRPRRVIIKKRAKSQ